MTVAILGSMVLTPLVGLVMGAYRWRKNRSDALKMIAGGLVIWVVLFGLLYAAQVSG